MGYSKTAFKGFSWLGILRLVIRGIGVIRTAILARLLNPVQFGVFGIATLILGLLEMFTETGINVFLIQEDDAEVDQFISTAWVTSLVRGLLISALVFIASEPLALFFNTPDAAAIIRLIALVPLIRGFINPAVVNFQKHLRFHKEFLFRSTLFAIEAAVSIAMAYATRSPMSLVWGMVASSAAEAIISLAFITPRPRFAFNAAQWRQVLERGKWVTGAGVFNYLFKQGPDIAIGKIINSYSLGLYQMANRLSINLSMEVIDVFNKVTFPIYVKIVGDRDRARRAYNRNSLLIALLVAPGSLVLILFPKPIVTLILGANWLETVPLMQISGVIAFIAAIAAPASALFLAAKKQQYLTLMTAVTMIVLAICVVPLTHLYGVMGSLYALLIAHIAGLITRVYLVEKVLASNPLSK